MNLYIIKGDEMNYRTQKYKTGLNINKYVNCNDHYHINNLDKDLYSMYMCKWFVIAIIPSDSVLKDYNDGDGCWVRKPYVNKIIFSNKYKLYNLANIKKFNIPISFSYVAGCLSYDHIDIIEYLLINDYNKYAKYMDLDIPSTYGNLNMLNLLKKYGIAKYSSYALENAIRNSDINVLEWWKNSGLYLLYNPDIISSCRNINVLEWCKNNGLRVICSINTLKYASWNGHVNVLEWWLKQNIPLIYDEWAINYASKNGHINVLNWWFHSGLELKYDKYAIYNATMNCHINVLEWWRNSGLELKYDTLPFSHACVMNSLHSYDVVQDPEKTINVLEWWMNSNLELKYDINLIRLLMTPSLEKRGMHPVVKKWLEQRGIL
jgi:hypothetical protein